MSDAPQIETTETKSADPMDAALDAALAKAESDGKNATSLIASPSEGDGESKGPKRGADGKFAKSDDAAAQDEASETKESKFSDDEVRRAVKAAQRYKSPKSVLKAIESGDEDAISYALNLAKMQDDFDKLTDDHLSLKKKSEQTKPQPAADSGERSKAGAETTPPSADDLAELIAGIHLDLTGDDKSKDAIKERVRKSLAGHTSQLSAQLDEVRRQNETLQKRFEAVEIERARDSLITEYPDLKEREIWNKVKDTYSSLPESAERPDIQTRLEHAARIELAPELMRRAKAEQERRNKLRDQGTPSAAQRVGETKAKQPDLQDQYLDALDKGDENAIKETRAKLKARLTS